MQPVLVFVLIAASVAFLSGFIHSMIEEIPSAERRKTLVDLVFKLKLALAAAAMLLIFGLNHGDFNRSPDHVDAPQFFGGEGQREVKAPAVLSHGDRRVDAGDR